MTFSRRDFLATAIVGSLSVGLQGQQNDQQPQKSAGLRTTAGKLPIIVCAHVGYTYLDDAYAFLKNGGDTLDAALRVVKGPEDDPNVTSVGLGGLPNEEGVVELDASCMHGPTRRAGSVGGVRNIKNVSMVAKAVFEHTGHVMLVGEGAERFAVAAGFPRDRVHRRDESVKRRLRLGFGRLDHQGLRHDQGKVIGGRMEAVIEKALADVESAHRRSIDGAAADELVHIDAVKRHGEGVV